MLAEYVGAEGPDLRHGRVAEVRQAEDVLHSAPGAPEPDPAIVPVVPVLGPGRPAVLVQAARTSGSMAAMSSHRRLFTITTAVA